MANRTLTHPKGILEDVLIKVGKFFILVDFVVINMEEEKQVSLIDLKKKGIDYQG